MPAMPSDNRSTPWGLFVLTAAMLALILYFGLHFKGASGANDVSWIGNRAGIHFGRNGVAHGTIRSRAVHRNDRLSPPFSISLAIQPGDSDDGHFRFLLLLHGGEDENQLVVGQWRRWLIIMNGDDYDYRRRRARIAVDILEPHKERCVTITSGKDGTTVFVDGQRIKTKSDLHLKIPGGGEETQLVLGNSIYGRHPWEGNIYGLAIFDRKLAEPVIANHFHRWQQEQRFAFALSKNTYGLYLFDEGRGDRIVDHARGQNDFVIPAKMTILTKEFLVLNPGPADHRLYQDMVINLLGFIPMGFLLSALLWQVNYRHAKQRLLVAMIACGAISLGIELAQAWIPSRSSQMSDLLLNTLGAGAGVLLHHVYHYIFGPASTEE
mgnify:CR=1 FL=1